MISAASATEWPSNVVARYGISFAGFDVGTVKISSEVGPEGYTLVGQAKVSAVFGAFKWQAYSRSHGQASSTKPIPKKYALDYRGNSKRGAIRMAFEKGSVVAHKALPRKPYSKKHAPLRHAHLQDVYDPISALMAITRGVEGRHPCRRRIPIFDGRQRFDLVFKPAGRKRIREARPSGQPEIAYVCEVRYVPIGGHKKNKQTAFMAKNRGIRVVLRSVPSADLFIPHEIRVPTAAGLAVLSSKHVTITTSRRQRIALIY
ncbi:MAG: DUF3108 domain-containing protein [Hyphomicrobiaceae bacterium]